MANAIDQVDIERIQKEKWRFARRKCYYDKDERDRCFQQFLEEAKKQSAHLIECANIEASKISREARQAATIVVIDARSTAAREAMHMRIDVESKIVELIERSNTLCHTISNQEAHLEVLRCQQLNPQCRPPITSVEMRKKDARRKRDAYWNARLGSSIELGTNRVIAGDPSNPNRKHRSVICVVTIVVESILSILKPYNDVAKRQFFKHFWLHKAVSRFQSHRFGNAKLDASVSATVRDLRSSLQVIKTAKQKDHLATKHVVLTTIVGQSTVGSRCQSVLAKALGIGRQNMLKASKQREMIDKDWSVRYPMGEHKV
jgi:hypothetical protein